MKTIKTLLIGAAVVASLGMGAATAGDILPNRGAALAMGCTAGEFGADSQGLSCKIGGYTITREIVVEAAKCKEDKNHKPGGGGGGGDDCETIETIVSEVPGYDWNYWMPINDAEGTVTRNGMYITVNGTIFTDTERVGIYDKFLVLSQSEGRAVVVHNQNYMNVVYKVNLETGVTQFGSEALGYVVHALND